MDIPIPDVYTDVARRPPGNRRMNDTLTGRIS
ncbi:enoyl-CoA hydratase, partial [Pseudomonas aeruginosa]|nr:enoyl-CoA hydratase [Pseudomonas aeruginosa]